jgi:DoxX-like protein
MKRIGIVAHSAEGGSLCFITACREGQKILGAHMHPEIIVSAVPIALPASAPFRLWHRRPLTRPRPVSDDESSYESATNWAVRICVGVFDTIGLGQWFRYFTGVVEVLGGLLFLLPAVTIVGTALLAAAMVGAMVVHIFVFKRPANIILPGAYLVGVLLAFAKLHASRRRRAP